MNLTAEQVRTALHYDPDAGLFRWKIRTSNRVRVGDVAGSVGPTGYVEIGLLGHRCYGHRLAWLYVHGVWPPKQIDHINMSRSDNRINNLRLASNAQNNANRMVRSDSKSRLKGVFWHGQNGYWTAQVRVNGVRKHLGVFDTPEAAHEAYKTAAEQCHGEFARTK